MAQLGEPVFPGEFVSELKHDEKTCPWHGNDESSVEEMEVQKPDEDTDAMPPNLGTALGKNLGKKEKDTIHVAYRKGEVVPYKVGKGQKNTFVYEKIEYEDVPYELQYAPHHLIPGNESLKGSAVVAYLGSDDVIKNFKGGVSSKIKPKKSVGYDVNRAENGVWLPSPYALSMANAWPGADAIKALIRIKGDIVANAAENFKDAYVAAAIDESHGCQFHMRHKDYSRKVGEILEAIGNKLKLLSGGDCPEAKSKKQGGKFDPPMGLKGRLDVLSNNLRGLLTGEVWREPLYTDSLIMNRYITNKNMHRINGLRGTIDKIV